MGSEEQAMETFLEQINLADENGKGAAQVQNISSYLNVRSNEPLQLFPNFKNEKDSMPCEHRPAVYIEPKISLMPILHSAPDDAALEYFEFWSKGKFLAKQTKPDMSQKAER